MVFGYIRVSTRLQLEGNGLEVQKNAILEKYSSAYIIEEQFTGRTTDRPKFNEMIKKLKKGDKLVVHKLDRLSRTTLEGLNLIEELIEKNVEVEVLNFGEVVGGFTSSNRLMFQILMAFAEYERNCIIERTQSGKYVAKQNPNFREGRPSVYSKTQKQHALELLNEGKTYKEVEGLTGISKSTLIRYRSSIKE